MCERVEGSLVSVCPSVALCACVLSAASCGLTLTRHSPLGCASVSSLSKEKKASLEQKVVSFEQKKLLLDKLVEDTGIQNLGDFIARYNEQERAKAAILARIDAKSSTSTFACALGTCVVALMWRMHV